jgi:hypothetical protein
MEYHVRGDPGKVEKKTCVASMNNKRCLRRDGIVTLLAISRVPISNIISNNVCLLLHYNIRRTNATKDWLICHNDFPIFIFENDLPLFH